MSLAKFGYIALLATMVAHAPAGTFNLQVANNLSGTNRVKASSDHSQTAPAHLLLPLQSKNPDHLGVGKVLVASRNLGDPNFTQTVILLIQYDASGAAGLILNRRTEIPLSRALEGNKAAKDLSDPLYLGGPVDPYSALALLKSSTKLDGAQPISDGVNLVTTKALFDQTLSARTSPRAFRVYLGYAGWHKDQLQKEVERGAWFIFPADAGTVFNSDPDSLWPEMIRKTELKLARSEPRP